MDGSNWNFEIELVGARIGNWDSAELELKGERRERSFLSRVYRVIIECLSSVYPVSIQCLSSVYPVSTVSMLQTIVAKGDARR